MAGRRKPDKSTAARNAGSAQSSKEVRLKTVTVESGAVVTEDSDVMIETEGYDPCVGRVHKIYKENETEEEVLLRIYWYYIPKDTRQGRQTYQSDDEIFISRHSDSVPADSVLWTCAVLPMDKFVAYRNFMNRREGKRVLSGPVEPCPHFSPAVDLAPCRDLCQLEPAGCDGLGSRKRKRSEDGDGEADKDRTNESADSGSLRSKRQSRGSFGSCFAHLYPSHLSTVHSLARRLYSPGNASSKTTQQGQLQEEESSEDEDDYKEHNRVFLWRGECGGGRYDHVSQVWKDCEVTIYCTCNLPYNPDKQMMQCQNCLEWYHEECTKDSGAQKWVNVAAGKTLHCAECQKNPDDEGDSDEFDEN